MLNSVCVTPPPLTIPAKAESYDDLEYRKVDKDEDGVYDYIEITSGDYSAVSVDIPAVIEGLPVTSIGDNAFAGYTIKSITIPDSVTSIEWCAFSDCTNLTSINIPDSVTNISFGAFAGCESLTSINIPDSVTSIKLCTFERCKSLKSVTIPNSVTYIGDSAFYGCESLASITIPDSVTSIGGGAFSNTPLLNNQTSEVKYADKWVIVCDKDTKTAEIKDGIKGIAQHAFADCTSLKSITIPDSVTYIDWRAFANCTSLESITILNPDCEIYDSSRTICNIDNMNDDEVAYYSGTIYGYEGSTAQAYAKIYNRKFVSLGDKPEDPTDPTEKPTEPVTTTAPVDPPKPTETSAVKPDPTEPSEGNYYLGNVDGNTAINIFDAVFVAQYTVGKQTLTPEQFKAADVDHSGKVNIFDAVIIAKYTVGTPFPD